MKINDLRKNDSHLCLSWKCTFSRFGVSFIKLASCISGSADTDRSKVIKLTNENIRNKEWLWVSVSEVLISRDLTITKIEQVIFNNEPSL